MSATNLAAFIARCRLLCQPRAHVADDDLLRRFTLQRDADAFGHLLERYASLVWGVCRRVLRSESDREDAFQATFLALVSRPHAVDPHQPLGAWLHTVAVRVAQRTLTQARRLQPHANVGRISNPSHPCTAGDVADDVGSVELFRIVDEEIERLPAKLRGPLVLCCLEGRTRDEAAEALGCSLVAVKSRLQRGRDLLRRRLDQRGVQLPAAFLVLGLTAERIRAALWAKTMQTVLYTPAPALTALAEAGVPTVTMTKSKLILAALLLVSGAAGAAGSLLMTKLPEPPAALPAKAAVEPRKPQPPQPRTDRHGDPLPDGAIARLGTVRWRHGFGISGLAYSPDGKMIAAAGSGRALTLWDAATGREVRPFPNISQPPGLAFSPNGKMIATTGINGYCFLWDVASGKELRRLEGHRSVVYGVAFSPDGKKLATSGSDSTVRLWNVATGKQLRRIDCGSGTVWRIVYSPDGKEIASTSWDGSRDGTIIFWDPETGKERRQMKGPKRSICSVVFSPDGKRLASSSSDGTIRLWDTATGRQSRILAENLEKDDSPIAFSPDGALLASGHQGGTIRLWDVAKATEKRRWQAGEATVRAVAFEPDGKTLATGTAWGNIRLWDVATARERYPSHAHRSWIDLVRFSVDGANLVSIGHDHRMLWWDLATQIPRRQFTLTAKGDMRTALSPDGNTLAVGSYSDFNSLKWETRLLDIRTGKPGRLLDTSQGGFWPMAFSPDGRLVASSSDKHVIHIWEASSGKEVQQIKDVPHGAESLCFSPDGKALAGTKVLDANVQARRALCLWDVASGKQRVRFDVSTRKSSQSLALAFSPDGKVLAAAAGYWETSMVRLWDTATGKELCRHTGHGEEIGAIAFSPDGKLVASSAGCTGTKDNSVHVWEAATGRLLRRFQGHHSCVGCVAFSPQGLTVASGAGDSTILLWDITVRGGGGPPPAKPLTAHELEDIWNGLANEDAAKAYDGVWRLVATPEHAVPFLRKQLPPLPHPDAKAVARWIADLDSDDFAVRQRANEELSKLGDSIAPALRNALQGKPSLETRRRIQQLLDPTRNWTPERLRSHRAIQALEHIGTQSAREVLQALAAGAPEARLTKEAKESLQRMNP